MTSEGPIHEPASLRLLKLVTGKWVSQAIYAAAELGIADLLSSGDKSVQALAHATGSHPDSLYRLLRGLTAVDVFAEGDDRAFRNTELSEVLRSDAPATLRGFAQLMGMDATWKAWGDIVHSVRTGECAFVHACGQSPFEYISARPAAAAVINDAMTSMSEVESAAVVGAYDFSGAHTIVDVGGGHGLLLSAILKANPSARGIVFELPHAVAGAKDLLRRHGLDARTEVVAGDAFESVVAGADLYILKHVVHDWDDERSVRLLKNCANAAAKDARVLLIEPVLTAPGVPHFAKLLDLEMLIMSLGGRERTAGEYGRLYAAAGLKLRRIVPTGGPNSVIEGLKP